MSRLATTFFCLMAILANSVMPACAIDVGLFVRPGTTAVPSPVTNKTYLLDTTSPSLKYWNGTSWITQTPPYYNLAGSGAPGVNQDSSEGYQLGSLYYDTVGGIFYYCTDPTLGAAVWIVAAANIPVPVPISKGGTGQITRAAGFNALAPDTLLGGLIVGDGANSYANLGIGSANTVIASQAGTAAWAALTAGTGLSVSGLQYSLQTPVSIANGGTNNAALTVPAGGLFSSDGTRFQNLGVGNAFQMAMSNGTSLPSWAYTWSGSQSITASSTTLTAASPSLATIDNSSNAIAITLPSAATVTNQVLGFIHTAGTTGANTITISRAGSDTIEGATSLTLAGGTLYGMLIIQSDGGTTWKILNYLPTMAQGTLFYADANNRMAGLAPGTSGFVLQSGGASGNPSWTSVGSGTVTTFSATPSAIFDVATATSTPALSLDNQSANIVLAGPSSGGAATPGFRALVQADLPTGSFPFGGNGSDGAVSITTSSVSNPTQYNATTWTTVAGNTLTYTGVTNLAVNATSTFDNPGTITMNGTGGAGGAAGGVGNLNGQNGAGPGGGTSQHSTGAQYGGGGGGFGGIGGRGGDAISSGQKGAPGGATYGVSKNGGSGGGAGLGDGSSGNGGAGGAGGGALYIMAVGAVTNAGTINNTGSAGSTGGAANGGGGGGGSGGLVYMASLASCSNAGTITVAGGAGGAGNSSAGGGGGGGGGRIIRHSPSNTGAGTFTVSGGGAGALAGGGGNGVAGSSGVSSTITGTPSNPLIAWMKNEGLDWLAGVEQLNIALGHATAIPGGYAVDTQQATMSWGAARNNVAKFCYFNNGPTPINDGVLCQDGKEEAALTAGELEAWKDAS